MISIDELPFFIFDWSGVISDDREPVYESNMRLLEAQGFERISMDEWRKISGSSAAGFLRNYGLEVDNEKVLKDYQRIFNELSRDGIKPVMYR